MVHPNVQRNIPQTWIIDIRALASGISTVTADEPCSSSLAAWYTSIQMKCQGGVIFVHAPRLFYYPKRRIGYARCSLTGNKNYQAIQNLQIH